MSSENIPCYEKESEKWKGIEKNISLKQHIINCSLSKIKKENKTIYRKAFNSTPRCMLHLVEH